MWSSPTTREMVRTKAEGWEKAQQWLTHGTFAGNAIGIPSTENEGVDLCIRAVGWEYVIGMYTKDPEPSPQERAAAAMEKLAKDQDRGEEWRGGDED